MVWLMCGTSHFAVMSWGDLLSGCGLKNGCWRWLWKLWRPESRICRDMTMVCVENQGKGPNIRQIFAKLFI